jgi:hypothetical protein
MMMQLESEIGAELTGSIDQAVAAKTSRLATPTKAAKEQLADIICFNSCCFNTADEENNKFL